MNKTLPLLAIILLLFSITIFVGCEKQQAKVERLSKEKTEEIKERKEYLEQFYRRPSVLLALKYKVEEEKVFNILIKEENFLYNDIENIEDFLFGKGLKERIERYSEEYNIPTDIIASILMDYEAMQGRE